MASRAWCSLLTRRRNCNPPLSTTTDTQRRIVLNTSRGCLEFVDSKSSSLVVPAGFEPTSDTYEVEYRGCPAMRLDIPALKYFPDWQVYLVRESSYMRTHDLTFKFDKPSKDE